jgi:hypothetical protein
MVAKTAARAGPGGIAASPDGSSRRAFLMTPTLIRAYDKTARPEGRHMKEKEILETEISGYYRLIQIAR